MIDGNTATPPPARKPLDAHLDKSWMPSKSSNIKAYYRTVDKTLVLNTTKIEIGTTLDFETDTLHIYAETIRIESDISLPGKNLGLFCHSLELNGKCRTIDVSGITGRALPQSDGDKVGNPGNPGGTISIYVEDLNNALVPNRESLAADADKATLTGLYLYAMGGDGGPGNKMGKGGNAGDGGNVYFYYGHPLDREYADLQAIDALKGSWKAKISLLNAHKFGLSIPDKYREQATQYIQKLTSVISFQYEYFSTLEAARVLLQSMDNSKTAADLRAAVMTLSKTVRKVGESEAEPILTKESVESINNTAKNLDPKKPSSELIQTMNTLDQTWKGIKFLAPVSTDPKATPDEHTVLGPAFKSYLRVCRNVMTKVNDIFKTDFNMKCMGGKPGAGGEATNHDTALNGDQAKSDGRVSVQELVFSEEVPSLTLEFPVANPNQCQMLLNRADDLYFQGYFQDSATDALSYFKAARKYYMRLSRRLCFLPKLTAGNAEKFPLMTAYGKLEVEKLSLQPLPMLVAIKSKADLAISHMKAGQDMFGFNTTWVPRLSFTYYKSRMDPLIQRMNKAETLLDSFKGSDDNRVYEFQRSAVAHKYSCRAQIDALLDPKGPMKTAANQIQMFTGPLKQKRQEVIVALASITNKIKDSENCDPKIFIDALCMTAMGPSVFNGLAQGMSALYTAGTTVHAADGTNVNKDYVVSQFKDAGDSFSSLEEGYKCRLDGSMEVDDPGAAKLIAGEAKIESLLNKFASDYALKDEIVKLIKVDYLRLIKSRNNAVLAYNSCVQLYHSLLDDESFYHEQAGSLGQTSLKLSEDGPILELMLLKSTNDLRSLCQQTLVFGEKALNYWGLVREHNAPEAPPTGTENADETADDNMDELAVSLVPSSITLENKAEDLLRIFQGCLAKYADNPGCIFPNRQIAASNKDLSGIRYWVPKDRLANLKKRRVGAKTLSTGESLAPEDAKFLQYYCDFDISPVMLNTTLEENPFAGRCDVRIDQIRAWIIGAKVGKRETETFSSLSVELQHWGNPEYIVNPDNKFFSFKHDHVVIPFKYDPSNIKTIGDTANAVVFESQRLPQVLTTSTTDIAIDSMAPFGPFTNWKLLVRNSANYLLDLSSLADVCIEFWGTCKLFVDYQENPGQG